MTEKKKEKLVGKIKIKIKRDKNTSMDQNEVQYEDKIEVIKKKKEKSDLERKKELFSGWEELSKISRGIVEKNSER